MNSAEVCPIGDHRAVTAALEAARACITDPEHWGQGVFAIGCGGLPISARDKDACRFCAVGAVQRSTASEFIASRAVYYLEDATLALGFRKNYSSIIRLNDCGSHQKVLQVYDKAIELSKKGVA